MRLSVSRWIATVALVALAETFMVAPPASAEDTVLRFFYSADYQDSEMWRQCCEGFEKKNPGVRIKREWFNGPFDRKLQLVFPTGTAADILFMDNKPYPGYVERGYLEELAPYINRESDDIEKALAADLRWLNTPVDKRDPAYQRKFINTALESYRYKGAFAGVPWCGNNVLIFYNKDLFDQAGIPYPSAEWTWNDFRKMAKELTKDLDGDGIPDQYGSNIAFWFLGTSPLFWSFGADWVSPDQTRSVIQEPNGVAAGQFIYDLRFTDHSVAPVGQMDNFSTEVQLLTGRVGMVLGATYMIPVLKQVKSGGMMRWDVAPIPKGPGGESHTRATWDGLSINAHIPQYKKDLAWKFLKYCMSDDFQLLVGKRHRGIPITRGQALRSYMTPDLGAGAELALNGFDNARLMPITPRYLELREVVTGEFDALNVANTNGLTVPEVFARLEPKINRVLTRNLLGTKNAPTESGPKESAGSAFKAAAVAAIIVAGALIALFAIPPVRRGFIYRYSEARQMLHTRKGRLEAFDGIVLASPWLLGLLLFTAFPIIFSIVLSFCRWDPYLPISKMIFVGLANYRKALSIDPVHGDPLVMKSLWNTFVYAIYTLPLGICASLGLAILLNQKIRGITIFRTTFYLPSIVAGVATVILWKYIFDPAFGPLNTAIRGMNHLLDLSLNHALLAAGITHGLHLPTPLWLGDPHWTKPAVIIMALWGAGGGGMLIFLAGLQGVPDQLYEVADLDGASRLRKFWNITLPMLTPTIYFNFIMGVIGAFKVFMQAFVITAGTGGPDKSLLFYVLYLYNKAFVEYEMGYASALAWILFAIILALTMLIIKSSALWVYYEGDQR